MGICDPKLQKRQQTTWSFMGLVSVGVQYLPHKECLLLNPALVLEMVDLDIPDLESKLANLQKALEIALAGCKFHFWRRNGRFGLNLV